MIFIREGELLILPHCFFYKLRFYL